MLQQVFETKYVNGIYSISLNNNLKWDKPKVMSLVNHFITSTDVKVKNIMCPLEGEIYIEVSSNIANISCYSNQEGFIIAPLENHEIFSFVAEWWLLKINLLK
jgi:hypothetical protein